MRWRDLTLPGVLLLLACHGLERDNPVDPVVAPDADPPADTGGSSLHLAIPLPKALATVVDSLVARLEGPDMVAVVKPLDYPSPLGPATLTIGALSPGQGRTLTIEGYDLTGRLILSGSRSNITVVTGDTTRITLDLRLAIDPEDLDTPGDATPDTTSPADGDTTTTDPGDDTSQTGAETPAAGDGGDDAGAAG